MEEVIWFKNLMHKKFLGRGGAKGEAKKKKKALDLDSGCFAF